MTQKVRFENQFNQLNAIYRDGYSRGSVANFLLHVTVTCKNTSRRMPISEVLNQGHKLQAQLLCNWHD